jgi:hypothetical protein
MTNIFVTQTSDGWMVREVDEKTREQVSTRTFRSERGAFKHVMERVASGNARDIVNVSGINTDQYHWWTLDVEGVAKWFLNLYGDD